MGHCTYQRDPVTGEDWYFAEGSEKDGGERYARIYLELALRYWISFKEIWMLYLVARYGPEAYDKNFDLKKKLQEMEWEQEKDLALARTYKLPLAEIFRLWCRQRERLLRLANFFPHRAEEIEAFVREKEDRLIASIEAKANRERLGRLN